MRLISHQTSAVHRMILAGTVLALFLLPVFVPDARAADPRWYVGLSVPVTFLDDLESVTSGTQPDSTYRADAVNEYKAGFKS